MRLLSYLENFVKVGVLTSDTVAGLAIQAMLMMNTRSKVSRVKIGNCSQVSGSSPSHRLDVVEDRESRHTSDLRHVGGDPGIVVARARDSRRGKHAVNDVSALLSYESTTAVLRCIAHS